MPTLTDVAPDTGEARREAEDLLLEPAPPVPLTPLVLVAGLILAVVLLWTLIWGAVGPF